MKSNIRKIGALFLAVVAAFSFSACETESGSSSDNISNKEASSQSVSSVVASNSSSESSENLSDKASSETSPMMTSPNNAPNEDEIITSVKSDEEFIKNPSGATMYLYSKSIFEQDVANDITVELYVDAYPDENDSTTLEGIVNDKDGVTWSLLMRDGEAIFPLLPNENVIFGHIKYYLWFDYEALTLNVSAIVMSYGGIVIDEYIYNLENKTVTKNEIFRPSADSNIFDWSKGDYPQIYQP